MGCGGSKVSAVDGEVIDGDGIARQNSENGIKVSSNEETEQKSVQFSPEIKTNGVSTVEGKIIFYVYPAVETRVNEWNLIYVYTCISIDCRSHFRDW